MPNMDKTFSIIFKELYNAHPKLAMFLSAALIIVFIVTIIYKLFKKDSNNLIIKTRDNFNNSGQIANGDINNKN